MLLRSGASLAWTFDGGPILRLVLLQAKMALMVISGNSLAMSGHPILEAGWHDPLTNPWEFPFNLSDNHLNLLGCRLMAVGIGFWIDIG